MADRKTEQSKKDHKSEEIVAKLREVNVLASSGQSAGDAMRWTGVKEVRRHSTIGHISPVEFEKKVELA